MIDVGWIPTLTSLLLSALDPGAEPIMFGQQFFVFSYFEESFSEPVLL